MKKLFLLFASISLISCKTEVKPSYVVFNGTVKNSPSNTAKIYGNEFEAEMEIKENGSFNDTLSIAKDGYYTMRIGRESTSIYLTQGAAVQVKLNAKEFDETLTYTGDVAVENNYLAAKYLLSEKEMAFNKIYSLAEADFVKEVNTINKGYTDLLDTTAGLSETFINAETKELEYTHLENLENYNEYHIYFTKNKDFVVSNSYYDYIGDFNFTDEITYQNSSAYQRLLSTHFGRVANEVSTSENIDIAIAYLKVVNENFNNGETKDHLMIDYLRYGMKANNSLDEVYKLFKSSNQNEENLALVSKNYEVLKEITPGKTSPTFSYENFKGGETSLEDLKGKVVYVDVWATWCGPCKREIPYLKNVETDYHDKNIAFVSISIDDRKDYNAWRNMVESKELGGIQLMADKDWKSSFVTEYGIKGIPRFILIDENGKIVNSDAPRPSSPDLRIALDELL